MAHADEASDKAAIAERLHRWAMAFNAQDVTGSCDLFSPELVATTPERLDESRDALCGRLKSVFARPGLRLRYADPDINEIIVEGNLAVVRLVWTLTSRSGNHEDVSTEVGMDIFRRQPGGRWSITRYTAFTEPSPR